MAARGLVKRFGATVAADRIDQQEGGAQRHGVSALQVHRFTTLFQKCSTMAEVLPQPLAPSRVRNSPSRMSRSAGTPADTVQKLQAAITAALADPRLRQALEPTGLEFIGSSSAEFGAFLKSEAARYGEAIRISGAKAE